MVSKLWSDTPTISGSTALLGADTVYAIAFVPDVTQYIHGIRRYRSSTAAANKADYLAVWDTTTQEVICFIGSPSDNGAVGWQETAVGTTHELVAGREYRVGQFTFGGSTRTANFTTTAPSDPGNDLAFATTKYRYVQGAFAYPSLTASSYYCAVDVITDNTPPDPGSGVAAGDIANQLAAWLISTGDNTHQTDGIPWLSYVMQQGMDTNLDTLIEKLDAGGWPVVLGGVNKADLPAWLGTAGTILGSILALADSIKSWTDAPTVPSGGATTAGLLALAAQIQNGDLRYLTAPGGAGWVLDATVPFVGPFIVDQEADVIFVNITTYGDANRLGVYAGLSFLSFAWWWTPLRAGAISGRYHTSRALTADLYEPGRRLGGALVVVPPDFEGEYEVWRYTG